MCLPPSSSGQLLQDLVQDIGAAQSANIPQQDSTTQFSGTQATPLPQDNASSTQQTLATEPGIELSSHQASIIASAAQRADRQFILLCANYQSYDIRLAQIEVTQTMSDHHLMQQVRQAYFGLRSCFNERLSFLHPRTIQLVKVSKYAKPKM